MIDNDTTPVDASRVGNTPEVFIEYYNKNIPVAFPRATHKSLAAFQAKYPSLFKNDGEWIIEKHRKKYIDWLASYHEG